MPDTTPILYGITDNGFMSGAVLMEKVEAALRGGARWIQYRDKSGDDSKRFAESSQLLTLCKQHDGVLIINDDAQLAKKVSAHGVHLGREDTPIRQAREYLGEKFLIGATCHNSIEMAVDAQHQGANYLAFGRFFPSQTKDKATPAELTTLKTIRQHSSLPIVAIGGINLENATTLLQYDIDAIAVCRALFDCDDVQLRATQFLGLK